MIEHMFVSIEPDPPQPERPWGEVHVAMLDPYGYTLAGVEFGIRSLDRIIREAEAAMAVFVGSLRNDRDAVTRLVRLSGTSHREARRRRDLAAVVAAVPEAHTLLAAAFVSGEHVVALRPVIEKPGRV